MNKKGTHVDWVISMGIFVVYVFALFLFLRPGIKPVHKPVTLLNVLEENFRDDVMWSVKVVPLFIRGCSGTVDGESATAFIKDDRSDNKWKVGGIKDKNGEPVKKEFRTDGELKCTGLDFKDDNNKCNPFYFYFCDGEGAPKFIADCHNVMDITDCEVEAGVAEDINGINDDFLNELRQMSYEDLRKKWNEGEEWKKIPIGKDFAILDDDGYIVENRAPAKVNVFTRKITTQTVDSDGDVNPVSIYLQVW